MNKSSVKVYLNISIAVIMSILIGVCLKPSGSLTPAGVLALAVCLPTIYLWITVDTVWPSLIALSLILFTGVYGSASEVCAVSLGNASVMFTLMCMILSNILVNNGIMDRCTSFFLSRKFIKGKPYRFLFMYFMSILVLGNFIGNLSLILVACEFISKLLDDMGIKKHSDFSNAMYLGTLWICNMAGACCPIGKVLPIILIHQLPFKVSIYKWWSYGLIFQVFFMALLMFVLIFIWKPDEKDKIEIGEYEPNTAKMSTREIWTIIIFIMVVIMWVAPDIVPKGILPGVMAAFEKLDNFGPAALGIAALCIMRVDGEPVADIKAAIKKIPVHLLIFIAAVFMVSDIVSSPNTGIRNYLAEVIEPHLHGTSYIIIFSVILILALCLTNMTSDIAVAILFSQLMLTAFADTNRSGLILTMVVGMIASMSIMTPNASVPTSILYGTGNLKSGSVLRYSLILVIAGLIGAILIGYPLSLAIKG